MPSTPCHIHTHRQQTLSIRLSSMSIPNHIKQTSPKPPKVANPPHTIINSHAKQPTTRNQNHKRQIRQTLDELS